MARRIVALVADSHAGHQLGLLNPHAVLLREDDAGNADPWSPEQTKTQARIWTLYLDKLRELRELAGNDEIVAIHNGDLTWGWKYTSHLIASITHHDQQVIAQWNMRPIMALPTLTRCRFITGTESHNPQAAEARVSRWIQECGIDCACAHHAVFSVDGVTFDVSHHGAHPGSRFWLKGNVAGLHLKDRVLLDRSLCAEPSRVYVNAHYHTYQPADYRWEWGGKFGVSTVVILPSLSGMTQYARQSTRSVPTLTNGLVAFEIVDGRLVEIHPLMETIDLRSREEL